ncbi:MAG: hypothetical protein A3I11_03355 [Elusimicrobia bacterium RIFCSPLOWO2_02_FULL_39_32]|nr:MAG: hypothetical protein A3B80_01925 [Elusimicrobia bacterium RIFCSPHIGHO2_02_FULL_39_36]OGR92745.1 MAG: hypothetical protein A3I11_03355 [Elusimicrobia bacterium RIFCSPLOWO2_02_FULL_39_32]OGR99530.1 MAG: hypothetical protein A3G85_00710 [Elusimicrobia bacterium RIFCSPLOWO2_12_FULL_39_28]
MRRTILLFYFLFMVFLLSNFKMKGIAQEDLYSFPKIEEENTKKIVEKKSLDPFIETLVKKFSSDEKLLSESVSKGFGRRELIRLILMAKKSGKSLEELIKEREKGTGLKKIAESLKLDHSTIRKEALAISKEIEKNLEKRIKEKPPSPPTAGIAEQLDKKGASYSLLNSTGSIESEKKDERK